MYRVLTEILIMLMKFSKPVFTSKNDLIIKNLALRQQLSTYKAKKIQPVIKKRGRSFWIALKKSWYRWTDTLIIVKPETVYPLAKEAFQKALGKNIIPQKVWSKDNHKRNERLDLPNGKGKQLGSCALLKYYH